MHKDLAEEFDFGAASAHDGGFEIWICLPQDVERRTNRGMVATRSRDRARVARNDDQPPRGTMDVLAGGACSSRRQPSHTFRNIAEVTHFR